MGRQNNGRGIICVYKFRFSNNCKGTMLSIYNYTYTIVSGKTAMVAELSSKNTVNQECENYVHTAGPEYRRELSEGQRHDWENCVLWPCYAPWCF